METTSAYIELHCRNATTKIIKTPIKKQPRVKNMFKDQHIAKRMTIREADIEDLLKNVLFDPDSLC